MHDGQLVLHLLLLGAGALPLADRPEDVGQRLVHLGHVFVVQVVHVDGFLHTSKRLFDFD